jgi:hypothetical protein
MRRRAFAITLSGLLAAPGVMAACNPQFDRIETRIQASAAPQAQKSRLLAWVGEQRTQHRDAEAPQCERVAQALQRQVAQQLDQVDEVQAGQADPTGSDQATIDLAGADVSVAAPPSEVRIDQPPARIDVTQQAAEVDVATQPPQVTIEVPEPEVQVSQAQPRVAVSQEEPRVTVRQGEPEVNIRQPDPVVNVTQADPVVEVRQGDPDVQVQDSPAVVSVDPAQPEAPVRETIEPMPASRPTDGRIAGTGTEATAVQPIAATELRGVSVVNIEGHVLGRVDQVLKDSQTNQVFVRVDVDRSVPLDTQQLVLKADELESNAGKLLVRRDLEQLEQEAGALADRRFEPADGEQVVLAASADD